MSKQRVPLPEAGCGTHLWSIARVEARFQGSGVAILQTRLVGGHVVRHVLHHVGS